MVHRPKVGLDSPAPFISRCVFAIKPLIFRHLLDHSFLNTLPLPLLSPLPPLPLVSLPAVRDHSISRPLLKQMVERYGLSSEVVIILV